VQRPFWSRYRYPLLVFALSRAVTFGLFAMEGWVTRHPARSGISFTPLFRDLGSWDGIWYRQIAQHGYDPVLMHGNTAAFFPLYPTLLSGLRGILPFFDIVWLGAILSTALFAAGLCLLYGLTLERFGPQIARRTVLYLAISPLAFIFSAVYAESLFLVLAVGTFVCVERGRWILANAVGALAVLARPVGITLAPALAYKAWTDSGRRFDRRFLIRLAPVLLLPAAEVAFALFLWWRTGDPAATLHAQARGWGRGASFPPVLLYQTLTNGVLHQGFLRYAVDAAFAVFWLALFVVLWRDRREVPAEYAIFAAGVVFMPFAAGSMVSAGRLGMMGFPLFWALAILGRREGVDTAVKIVFPSLMAALMFITYGQGTFTP
jgi:hypothetical protein